MKKSRLFFGLLIVLTTIACDRFDNSSISKMIAMSNLEVVKNGSGNSDANSVKINSPVDKKKIIKDGKLSIKTFDIAGSKKNIDGLVKKYDAYYDSEELQNNNREISYDLKLRMPANNFEKFIEEIEKGKDEISNKSIHSRDVTEEFVDLEARLNNKREFLKRYKDLLSKAQSVKDILAIEENIRALQEEIESKEGRLKYLNDQVAYSTLDINLYKEKDYIYKADKKDNFGERAKSSISNGWTSIIDFFLWLITIWPFIILMVIAFYTFRWSRRKRKLKLQKSE